MNSKSVVIGSTNVIIRTAATAAASSSDSNKADKNIHHAVFVIHGRTGKESDIEYICDSLLKANKDIITIAFDLPNHGSRLIDAKINTAWSDGNITHALDMYSQMIETVSIISLCISLLPIKLGVAFSSVSVVGVSQGGHTALLALVHEPRVDACVAFISSGDMYYNFKIRYAKLSKELQEAHSLDKELIPPALRAFIEQHDTINNIQKISFGLRPLIMLNGANDTLVPSAGNEALYARLLPLYEKAGKEELLKLKIYPGVKHAVPPEMLHDGTQFLKNILESFSTKVKSKL